MRRKMKGNNRGCKKRNKKRGEEREERRGKVDAVKEKVKRQEEG